MLRDISSCSAILHSYGISFNYNPKRVTRLAIEATVGPVGTD